MAPRISEALVREQAGALGAGGLRFTARQLYHAVVARLDRPRIEVGRPQLVIGGLLCILGTALGITVSPVLAFLLLFGMVIGGLGVQAERWARRQPHTRPAPISYEVFSSDILPPLRDSLDGLIGDDDLAQSEPSDPVDGAGAPLIVCDHHETAALLRLNDGVAGVHVRATDEATIAGDLTESVVFALHDADIEGCGLALRLRAAGLQQVVDIGLRPNQLRDHPVHVAQQDPHYVDPEMAGVLTSEEIVWLADGRHADLASASTSALLATLRQATADDALAVTPTGAPDGVSLSMVSPLQPEPAATG